MKLLVVLLVTETATRALDAQRCRSRPSSLGFCRVEIDAKPLDSSLAAEGGDDTHVFIELPADPAVAPDKKVRLAKARFERRLHPPCLRHHPDRLYRSSGRAEVRAVALADRTSAEVVVTQGLDVGEPVTWTSPLSFAPTPASASAKWSGRNLATFAFNEEPREAGPRTPLE